MMQKEKSGGVRRMRVLALVIAPMVAFGVLNLPAVASDLKSLETVALRLNDTEKKQANHPYIRFTNNGGAELVVGSSYEKDCNLQDIQAFRVDGKLLREGMTIDMSDIESYKTYPPSKEFPGGLCDIKLKKK